MKKFALIILLATAGCVSSGVKVEKSNLAGFQKGKTTYAEVVEKLGTPTQTYVNDDGSQTAVYSYFSAQPRPESYIPYVGAFVAGADVESTSVVLMFDRRQVLTRYTTSAGSQGMGRGFEAQSQTINREQPGVAK